MIKKIFSLFLVLALCLSLSVSVFATDGGSTSGDLSGADGDGTSGDLNSSPTFTWEQIYNFIDAVVNTVSNTSYQKSVSGSLYYLVDNTDTIKFYASTIPTMNNNIYSGFQQNHADNLNTNTRLTTLIAGTSTLDATRSVYSQFQTLFSYVDGVEGYLYNIQSYVDNLEAYVDGVEGSLLDISSRLAGTHLSSRSFTNGNSYSLSAFVDGILNNTSSLVTASSAAHSSNRVLNTDGTRYTVSQFLDAIYSEDLKHTSTLNSISGFVDGIEGYIDGVESSLSSIGSTSTSILGYVDGVETVLTNMYRAQGGQAGHINNRTLLTDGTLYGSNQFLDAIYGQSLLHTASNTRIESYIDGLEQAVTSQSLMIGNAGHLTDRTLLDNGQYYNTNQFLDAIYGQSLLNSASNARIEGYVDDVEQRLNNLFATQKGSYVGMDGPLPSSGQQYSLVQYSNYIYNELRRTQSMLNDYLVYTGDNPNDVYTAAQLLYQISQRGVAVDMSETNALLSDILDAINNLGGNEVNNNRDSVIDWYNDFEFGDLELGDLALDLPTFDLSLVLPDTEVTSRDFPFEAIAANTAAYFGEDLNTGGW